MTAPIGFVDTPDAEAVIGTAIRITGWALDAAGIDRVEVRIGGEPHAARYGLARADVAAANPGHPGAHASGFAFEADFAPLSATRHQLAIVAVSRTGAEQVLATKSLIPIAALAQWQPLYAARHQSRAPPFYILPALSGVSLGAAAGLDSAYTPYLSPTLSTGMRVPILYLRTTLGAAHDWIFDPDWDIERRCGERRIAEDSLSAVIAHSIRHGLPVLFTLNGGIWADAACSAPEWDINDHLEQDEANCQWNERNQVMPEDYLAHLPGLLGAPEIGRSLTFNVYAARNRHYKKRNLQAAARAVAAFAHAHPDLFVGVSLDPDTYLNPFYPFGEQRQWYDYNPGTIRQFRQWLAGGGPYASQGDGAVPDLSRYRRQQPMSLAEVRERAGKPFPSWDEVEPPRAYPYQGEPFWEDAWTHEWEVFRRHLVQLHYDELSQWVAEAGVPAARIYSAQGFLVRGPAMLPLAVYVDSPTRDYDGGGMSIEGAIPTQGHLGAIVYGAGALNQAPMEAGAENLFATFHRMDPAWAIVEFNTADFQAPQALPDYAMAYRALREMFNYGARFVSPMAWNGSSGLNAGQPGYVSFMAWRNTPLEDAMRDFAVSHAFVPLGARLWTFGSPRHADTDGWAADDGARLVAGSGYLDVTASACGAVLLSPSPLALARGETDLLVLGVAPGTAESVGVDARAPAGGWVALAPPLAAGELARTPAGLSMPLIWPATLGRTDQLRVALRFRSRGVMVRISHIALYPVAR